MTLTPSPGQPVIDVLRSKHPEPVIPPEEHFLEYDDPEECLESLPIYAFEENVAKSAAKLSGGAGPCGVDGISLKTWLLKFGAHSTALRDEMAKWEDLLANGSPDYAAYPALNAVR